MYRISHVGERAVERSKQHKRSNKNNHHLAWQNDTRDDHEIFSLFEIGCLLMYSLLGYGCSFTPTEKQSIA